MRTYVVGDIQACYTGLRKVLEKANFNPRKDTLWAVGDLIGRGPEALETVEYLMSLGAHFNTVLGNHDLHFLAVSQGIKAVKERDGFSDILNHKKRDKIIQWFREKPLAATPKKDFFLTHAGLYPLWSQQQALILATATADVLRSNKWLKLMTFMYGSEETLWQDNLSGLARHKFTIDALTRMRFVDHKGMLNLHVKTALEDAPKGFFPWFEHPKLHHKSPLLFGHWAALQGHCKQKHIHALDTGYIWGGKMTLLCLDTLKVTQVKAA